MSSHHFDRGNVRGFVVIAKVLSSVFKLTLKYEGYNYDFFMLRKKEKQTLTRLFLLGVGAPIGLDRFYEGDVTGGLLAILGFLIALITVVGLLVWILPFISKTFRLLREFEDAED